MKPNFDTINEGKKRLFDIWQSYPILSEIDNIKAVVSEKIEVLTPDELSRACVKLSILLCSVGGLVAEFVTMANESYIFRKFSYAWEYTTIKNDVRGKNREESALMSTIEVHRAELINRFVSDFMKTYKDDIERLVSSMQSRLRTLQSERINSNQQP